MRGEGPLTWDAEGNEYVDYHATFAPHFLGHKDPDVTRAVEPFFAMERACLGRALRCWKGGLRN